MMPLTPEAKQLLATTVRALRERLLKDVHDEADRRYRLSVTIEKAGLDEAHRRRRERLDAWLDEKVRAAKPKAKKDEQALRARFLASAEKEAAATFLNRIVLLRHLEAMKLSKPEIVTGGWKSKGYKEWREFAPGLVGDDSEGYGTLLSLVFEDLAVDLPGLFGEVGLTRLFPIPPAALREVIEKLDDEALASAWTDDTTLGWTYQYWNDPEREGLDAKINGGGKIEPHEIASKTQMFSERYMVEWLLQNSLGLLWLSICKKHGWTADAEAVLPVLDARRAEWRKRREAGEVALDALMPVERGLEDRWKYFVPQPIPEDAIAAAPASIRAVKLLDPACGSGHFLVIAFDLLAELYREEARHTGTAVSDRAIAESILENNLHGIDIDARAIQLAAAGLHLKAKAFSKDARPRHLNLVAPTLQLAALAKDDPALVALEKDLLDEAGIPEEVTHRIVTALEGVDHLGSLLKVDSAIQEVLDTTEREFSRKAGQGDLFHGYAPEQVKLNIETARTTVLAKLEAFLARKSGSGDLGLRLDGEQLAAGVRFIRIAKEGTYDVVVGNPPYQGTSKMANAGYVAQKYPRGKADLYAAFLERGLELARPGGMSALLTMRGWMFLGQFAELRKHLMHAHGLAVLGDVDRGAFEDVPDEVLSTVMSIFRRDASNVRQALAMQPTPLDDRTRDGARTNRKRAAVLAQVGRYEFDPRGFEVIDGEPIVYWWSKEFLAKYAEAPKLGDLAPVRKGLCTCNDLRYVRKVWELRTAGVLAEEVLASDPSGASPKSRATWFPTILGSDGLQWIEPLRDVVNWRDAGMELKVGIEFGYGVVSKRVQSEAMYLRPGVAFSMIGNGFSARAHRYLSVFGNKGSSVFPGDLGATVCLMNSSRARRVLESLNPGIGFEVGDVNRLPVFQIQSADRIFSQLQDSFGEHESRRETSFEFRGPGPSAWGYAQEWAQRSVDRAPAAPLPAYEPLFVPPEPAAQLSFAMGVALGRFGANSQGAHSKAAATGLAAGTLFLAPEGPDSLDHAACALLHDAWKQHGGAIGEGDDLRTYLRKSFFAYHKKLYENRPIYFPLSSAKKSFVAFISIHRWKDDTLQVLLADHLMPERRRLEGELEDLKKARAAQGTKAKAEKRYAEAQKLLEELNEFIDKVTEIADRGPPPPDDKTPRREVDAKYVMDLDDGVMVNSAALWPLLEPQWKDPKKWWKELATAQGRKDYDWAHLSARYFPKRVAEKCEKDPSLGVAHKCFWRLHPAKAYAWELRLQDEIRPDFTIDEPGSDEARAKFLANHERDAGEIRIKEQQRRERKAKKADEAEESNGPLFEEAEEGADED